MGETHIERSDGSGRITGQIANHEAPTVRTKPLRDALDLDEREARRRGNDK